MIWKATMQVATEKFGNSDFDYPPVELKKSARNAVKTVSSEDVSEEPPKPQMPTGDINGDLINNNSQQQVQQPAQNPVSFNNTFLDTTAKPTNTPPVPPIPRP